MGWYHIELEPFDDQLTKHFLGFNNGKLILVTKRLAKIFPEDAIIYDEKLKEFLNNKKYRLVKPNKIYDILKYRC